MRENTEGFYDCTEKEVVTPKGREVTVTAHFREHAMRRLALKSFAWAERNARKRVTLAMKSNIQKLTGKLYADAFMAIAEQFPRLEARYLHVDAANALIASDSAELDVLVTENMYGDILSDGLAGRTGGLGLAPGANIGDTCAIFESVHGSADDIAGKGIANPAALMLSASMMVRYLAERGADIDHGCGDRIADAVRGTIASGRHVTGDLRKYFPEGTRLCGTEEFTEAVCVRYLGARVGR